MKKLLTQARLGQLRVSQGRLANEVDGCQKALEQPYTAVEKLHVSLGRRLQALHMQLLVLDEQISAAEAGVRLEDMRVKKLDSRLTSAVIAEGDRQLAEVTDENPSNQIHASKAL